MADRTLAIQEDAEPNEDGVLEGWHTRLRVERSAAGPPALLFIIEDWDGGMKASESVVTVPDAREFLQPILVWLGVETERPPMSPEDAAKVARLLHPFDLSERGLRRVTDAIGRAR
jgi:hypothetical protein